MSDGWSAYDDIGTLGHGVYMRDKVIYQYNFDAPHDSGVHTQTMEGVWSAAKKKLRRQCDTSKSLFPSYIKELVWRMRHKGITFGEMVLAIGDAYDTN